MSESVIMGCIFGLSNLQLSKANVLKWKLSGLAGWRNNCKPALSMKVFEGFPIFFKYFEN